MVSITVSDSPDWRLARARRGGDDHGMWYTACVVQGGDAIRGPLTLGAVAGLGAVASLVSAATVLSSGPGPPTNEPGLTPSLNDVVGRRGAAGLPVAQRGRA